jgi:DNA-binding FrmR family transcriptional regulator
MKKIIHRIHRIQGQMKSVEDALANEKVCHEVIPQLLAIKGSVDSLVRTYLEESLDGCMKDRDAETMKQVMKLLIARS